MGLRFARPVLLNAWINASRIGTRLARTRGPAPDFWADVRRSLDERAAGRSFVDIGTMWGDQWGAFDAAERGAGPVTALDVTPPTPACLAEQERRGTDVRFVTGDLHDTDVLRQVGVHDIVLCSGVLYHSPNPCLTLQRLRSITGRCLLLASQTIQEVPAIPNACVFYPGLTDPQRLAFAAPISFADGLTTPFDPTLDYSNWWWGISRSALHGMLEATGWQVEEEKAYRCPPGYIAFVIARPSATAAPTPTPLHARAVA